MEAGVSVAFTPTGMCFPAGLCTDGIVSQLQQGDWIWDESPQDLLWEKGWRALCLLRGLYITQHVPAEVGEFPDCSERGRFWDGASSEFAVGWWLKSLIFLVQSGTCLPRDCCTDEIVPWLLKQEGLELRQSLPRIYCGLWVGGWIVHLIGSDRQTDISQ